MFVIHLDVCYRGRRKWGPGGLGPGNNLGKIGAQQRLDPNIFDHLFIQFSLPEAPPSLFPILNAFTNIINT